MWIFPMAAAVVSAIFATLVAQQWLARQRPHQLAWSMALLMFAIASFSAGIGVLDSWSPTLFRIYYLFGAILNVPVLGLGSLYLLGPRKLGNAAAVVVIIASIFAAGAVFTSTLAEGALVLAEPGIPSGGEVMPEGVRTLSRYYSFAGFAVVAGGALWSAWKMARRGGEDQRRIAMSNILIAAGTVVAAVASILARFGRASVLGIGLLIAVSLMFAGFLRSRVRSAAATEPTQPTNL